MTAGSKAVWDRSLTQQLAHAFVAVSVLIAATLVVTGLCFGSVLGHFEPDFNSLIAGRDAIDEAESGMLDEETGLRGYLDSGDQVFLSAYATGQAAIAGGDSASVNLATHADLVGPILAMRLAQQRWVSEWATPALLVQPAVINADALQSFLLSGKTLLDAYRQASNTVNARVDTDIAHEQATEHDLVLVGLSLAGAMLILTIMVARRQHRALRKAVVAPINDLLSTMRRVGAGDLAAEASGVGPPELREVAAELGRMTRTLADERARIAAVEVEARTQAERLGLIVNVGREISGSLVLGHVAEAVTKAALGISGFGAARMWITNDEQHELNSVHDTNAGHTGSEDRGSLQMGEGLVGRTGQLGRTLATRAAGSLATEYRVGESVAALAVPMIMGTRIVGVLELSADAAIGVDENSLDVIRTLASQAATAVEAARFHHSAHELSHTDALTHLPNRRRLELDLDLEIARSQRYNRPIACIMLDVDNFKDVNDVHGHQAGDEILSEFGNAFARSLRDTDTAYRYGGEEFCVLLRETDAEAAAVVAERLCSEIATRFAGNRGTATVTASLGVAAIPSDAIDGKTLIAAADRALYSAKAAGRNCVVRATPTTMLRATSTRLRSRSTPLSRRPVVVVDDPAAV